MPNGKRISNVDAARTAGAMAGGVGAGGKDISDHDQETLRKFMSGGGGKALSDGDQRKLEGLLESGITTSDADRRLITRVTAVLRQTVWKHGGPVKKYASGGGVRKVKSYNY
jgi:hypothetical protein